jgi:hypothetical protein
MKEKAFENNLTCNFLLVFWRLTFSDFIAFSIFFKVEI